MTVSLPGTAAPSVEVPDGLRVAKAPVSMGNGFWQFQVSADPDPNTPPGPRPLTFRNRADGRNEAKTLPVTIEPARVDLPPLTSPNLTAHLPPPDGVFARPAGARLRLVEGKICPERIDRVLEDGTRVAFLLIPRRTDELGPSSYYIMENKVWNGLYRKLVQARGDSSCQPVPGPESGEDWERLPATNMSVRDAHEFAHWLGGPNAHLPSREQWDKAAGLYDDHWKIRTGPIAPDWDPQQPGSVAINLDHAATRRLRPRRQEPLRMPRHGRQRPGMDQGLDRRPLLAGRSQHPSGDGPSSRSGLHRDTPSDPRRVGGGPSSPSRG